MDESFYKLNIRTFEFIHVQIENVHKLEQYVCGDLRK